MQSVAIDCKPKYLAREKDVQRSADWVKGSEEDLEEDLHCVLKFATGLNIISN